MRRLTPVVSLFVALLAACNPSAPREAPARTTGSGAHGPWLHITQSGTATRPLHIWQQLGNRRQYDLIARSYVSNGAQGSTIGTFFNARVTFNARDGHHLVATAPEAIVDEVSNTLTLAGGVHARTDTGMTLVCDTLRYDPKTEMLHGRGHVVVRGPRGMRATGDRIDSDIALLRAVLR
jgi:hypothetical protein